VTAVRDDLIRETLGRKPRAVVRVEGGYDFVVTLVDGRLCPRYEADHGRSVGRRAPVEAGLAGICARLPSPSGQSGCQTLGRVPQGHGGTARRVCTRASAVAELRRIRPGVGHRHESVATS
jgi:hypothetical protein